MQCGLDAGDDVGAPARLRIRRAGLGQQRTVRPVQAGRQRSRADIHCGSADGKDWVMHKIRHLAGQTDLAGGSTLQRYRAVALHTGTAGQTHAPGDILWGKVFPLCV